MSTIYNLQLIIKALRKAIEEEDQAKIMSLYNEAKTLDLEAVSWSLFQEYDQLVDQANDILMEDAA